MSVQVTIEINDAFVDRLKTYIQASHPKPDSATWPDWFVHLTKEYWKRDLEGYEGSCIDMSYEGQAKTAVENNDDDINNNLFD